MRVLKLLLLTVGGAFLLIVAAGVFIAKAPDSVLSGVSNVVNEKAATQPACQVEVDAPASQRADAEKAARRWCSDLITKVGLVYEPGESMAMRLYLSPAGVRSWAHSQQALMAELEKSVSNLGKGNTQHYNFQYRDLTTGKRLGGCSREPRTGQGLECSVN